MRVDRSLTTGMALPDMQDNVQRQLLLAVTSHGIAAKDKDKEHAINPACSPKAVRRVRVRLKASLCGIVLAPWLAFMAMVPSAARAQAVITPAPHGLSGSDAWWEHIAQGVDFWLMAHERASRALLLGRCSGLDRTFPKRPSPAMVAASSEVLRWMNGEAHTEWPHAPLWAALRDTRPILVRHTFSAEELASWDSLRQSPEGRRGLAVREVRLALVKVSDKLVDERSGQYWGWPLARLVRLADAHGLGTELDATFNKAIRRDAAALLRRISLVPGETPADERLLAEASQSGERLAEAFMQQLNAADRQAYQRLEPFGVLQRWHDTIQALHQLVQDPAVRILREQAAPPPAKAPEMVTAFCDRSDLSPCQPGGEVHKAVNTYRTAIADPGNEWATSTAARQIVRGLPSSGCPEPK